MKITKMFMLLFSFVLLTGCSTGSSIVTGNRRAAINPTEVKIYIDAPAQYETIGLVEASDEVAFSTQASQDRVVKELKAQAAKLGANGVLIISTDSKRDTSDKKVAQGKAIYVVRE